MAHIDPWLKNLFSERTTSKLFSHFRINKRSLKHIRCSFLLEIANFRPFRHVPFETGNRTNGNVRIRKKYINMHVRDILKWESDISVSCNYIRKCNCLISILSNSGAEWKQVNNWNLVWYDWTEIGWILIEEMCLILNGGYNLDKYFGINKNIFFNDNRTWNIMWIKSLMLWLQNLIFVDLKYPH